MNTSEVERLLRVVSGLLRKEWESKAGVGDLVKLSKARLDAEKQEARALKVQAWVAAATAIIVIFFVLLAVTVGESREGFRSVNTLTVAAIVGLIITVLGIFVSNLFRTEADVAKRELANYNAVFEKFEKSVKSLNPLGIGNTYHDVIDNDYIGKMASRLAYRVLDAESRFDIARQVANVCRYDVVRVGHWIEHCQQHFDTFWSAATTDFGQVLNKSEIFKSAANRLEKDNRNHQQLQTANQHF